MTCGKDCHNIRKEGLISKKKNDRITKEIIRVASLPQFEKNCESCSGKYRTHKEDSIFCSKECSKEMTKVIRKERQKKTKLANKEYKKKYGNGEQSLKSCKAKIIEEQSMNTDELLKEFGDIE